MWCMHSSNENHPILLTSVFWNLGECTFDDEVDAEDEDAEDAEDAEDVEDAEDAEDVADEDVADEDEDAFASSDSFCNGK